MINNYEEKNWKLLKDLLTPSWDGDYSNIKSVIVSFLKDNTSANIELQKVDKKKYNIIAIFGNPKFMFNCHMDTVPVTGNWITNPFELTKDKFHSKFFGLGTCDTKGNLWAILQGVVEEKPKNLMLAFTVDEEKGTASGMENLIADKKLKNIDQAIVFEPTSCEFITKHKGYYSFLIKINSKGGHSSIKQDKYSNAIVIAGRISQNLFKLGFNIGKISGGKAGNIVADECEIKVSIRTYETVNEINNTLKTIIKNEIENSKIKIDLNYIGIPFNNNIKKNKSVKKNILENLVIKDKEVNFWTEAALLQDAGINTVVYGAGSIEQAHNENEFVKIQELIDCKEQIKKIIREINYEKCKDSEIK